MGHYALPRWQQLIASLTEPVFFQQAGTLIVWHRQDAAEAQRFTRVLEANQQTTPELPPLQKLDSAALAQAEPTLAERFNHGLYLPGEGQLDNRQLLTSLLAEMTRLGVQMHWNAPRTPEAFAPGTPGQPDWVLDCRGLGASTAWPQLRVMGVEPEECDLLKNQHAPHQYLAVGLRKRLRPLPMLLPHLLLGVAHVKARKFHRMYRANLE